MATVLVEDRGTKRARTVEFKTKRPIDKKLISIDKGTLNTTQVSTDLLTATFPCTITGLRWSLAIIQDGGAGSCKADWAIVVAREGIAPDTLVSSDGSTTYNPEQDVLTFGSVLFRDNQNSVIADGSTKTMRKLMGGDKLVFIARGSSAVDTIGINGIIQFFCKS